MNYNLLDVFENTAQKYPHNTAFKDEKRSVTFSELLGLSQRLGTYISNIVEGKINQPVVVMVDRNLESLVAFLSVLYSGNFYVPIDNKTPEHRSKLIFQTLNPAAVITFTDADSKMLGGLLDGTIPEISYKNVVDTWQHTDLKGIAERRTKILDLDPVYAIFTSGSTGVPKGVLISHRGAIDLAAWLAETFQFHQEDILGNQTPFYFDGSVKDFLISLKTGATTFILAKKLFSFPKLLVQELNKEKITSILWATSAVNLLANSKILDEERLPYMRRIFFAGEPMYGKQLNYLKAKYPEVSFVNLYGPTEVTVDCTYYIVDRDFSDMEIIPIGKPCRNKGVLILNEQQQVAAVNEQGELCVRGSGLALGYYNNKEKTEEVFVQNPLNHLFADTIYRTGDMVMLNEQNEIVFVSRKDYQIKHMGNRIELGEIESVVNAVDGVRGAVCIYDQQHEKIILFYDTHNGLPLDIISAIKNFVPKYMFPNKCVHLETLPMNKNDKFDRVGLKENYLNGKYN